MPLLITHPAPKGADHRHRFVIGIHCQSCRGTNVSRDSTARWSEPDQAWEMSGVQDQGTCDDCNDEAHLVERLRDMDGLDAGPVSLNDCYDDEPFIERDTLILSTRELATVLAALRFWQRKADPRDPEMEIATDDGIAALTDSQIDALCERLNQ